MPSPLPSKVAEPNPASARVMWLRRAAALLAGASLTLAFAPHDLWWLALFAPAAQLLLWRVTATAREGAILGFYFGLGLYITGTWWLYISIRVFGLAPVWVALSVMAGLVLIMSAYQAALGYAVVRWLAPRSASGAMLLVPAAWVFTEWWRGWFLSGFPWLSLGYSQTDTWLAGLAPLGGVHLLSLTLLVGAGALNLLWRERTLMRALALVVLVLPWTTGLALREKSWTRPEGSPLSVAILQGAIPQDMKWLVTNQQNILDEYARLHQQALGAQLIVWPESALPDMANLYSDYIGTIWSAAQRRGSTVLMGVMRAVEQPDAAENVYFNSLLALDAGDAEAAFYDKRHLVPFGEYFPVPQWVRNWLRLMNLPYSDFTPGTTGQPPLKLAGQRISASICYEDAYPAQLRGATADSTLLATVTNDAWFGRSGARYQHFQISRMRALEARRPLLRAANDGVSALIDAWGRTYLVAPEFEPSVLRGTVQPRSGLTPYLALGDWPVLGLASALLAVVALRHLKNGRRASIKVE
jgi:apolipoprotein N-acyltransferase